MSKKLIVTLICLILVLLFMRRDNTSLDEAQSILISKMLESEKVMSVFSMANEAINT